MADNNNGTWWIWKVFIILFVVTSIEVGFGIWQPEFMMGAPFGTSWLNIFFIVLTLVKAYFIVSYFMHLGHEKKSFKLTIYLPSLILIPYLTYIVLVEGAALFDLGGSIF